MQTFQLYVGANNTTKRLELAKIRRIVSARHNGFTVYPVQGYWHGEKEETAIVIINDNTNRIKQTIEILKGALQQEAIGYQVVPNMQFA